MPRTYQNVCLTLDQPTLKALDNEAHAQDRPRSYVARKLLEKALTGQERLDALRALAAAELDAANARGDPVPNPGDVIAATSVDGQARRAALDEIAAGNRKATR